MASASPRRAALIRKIPWLRATVFPSCVHEQPYAGGDPAAYAVTLARQKAQDVYERVGGTVIGADTVVYIDGTVLGKPKDDADAQRMLRLLCGRTHRVITGYCVLCPHGCVTNAVTSFVTFKAYDGERIRAYIATGAPKDKAGGYGLQDEMLSPLIENVRGDTDNVIGLPVKALGKTLEEIPERWQLWKSR